MEFDNSPDKKDTADARALKRLDARMRNLIPKLKFPDQLPDGEDYKQPYLILFNGITSALDELDRMNFGRARNILRDAQQDAEEAYISAGDGEDEP